MKRAEGIAYARAGLLGNPSDGYFGKIIAVSVRNFRARVVLEENPEIVIIPAPEDEERYAGLDEFAHGTFLYGYYGGVRLVKAAIMIPLQTVLIYLLWNKGLKKIVDRP